MQKTKPTLKIDWATHEAAKYACKNWHYSGCLPAGAVTKFGVWENEKFIGVVLFSRGATPNLCKPYNLKQTQCVELTRIALTNHISPVSKIMAICLKLLKNFSPVLELIISFADTNEGHHGGIYQATNWIYTGKSNAAKFGLLNGKEIHPRTISTFTKQKKQKLKWILKPGKHRYLYPLQNKEKYLKLSKPYPKRVEHEINASGFHSEEGGAVPTDALQSESI